MNPEVLAYPFLFVALFFESFALVTLLSAPAREARRRPLSRTTPTVAIIVPCYNEAGRITRTVESLLALDYPRERLSVIVVDDGSTDGSAREIARFARHPQVTLIRKANGGKWTALNAGIAMTDADIIGCLDADSLVEPGALREALACFTGPSIAAVTPGMSVHAPNTFLEHMQNGEYLFGIALKHALAAVNGIPVTPGPFSLYRRSIVRELGGFRAGHQTEDLEMALRIQRAGYRIENAPRARVYTRAPRTLATLLKQRTRWTSGFLRNVLNEYRGMIGNVRHGALGTIVLPLGIFMIVGSATLFFLSLITFAHRAFAAYETRAGIPLSYAFSSTHVDWFYLPSAAYLVLGLFAVAASLSLIVIGKRVSRTPGSLVAGLCSYLVLYGLIAPLWLMRAGTDVAFGIQRRWR